MQAPCWWIEDLERLREEQSPKTEEQLPLYHELPPVYEDLPPTPEEPVSRVIIIDL